MSGGLALLPLAPISAVTEIELPGVIKRMEQRLSGRRGRKQAALVWGAAYILLGLRHSPSLEAHLFRGVLSIVPPDNAIQLRQGANLAQRFVQAVQEIMSQTQA